MSLTLGAYNAGPVQVDAASGVPTNSRNPGLRKADSLPPCP